jgi:hypothetical protein
MPCEAWKWVIIGDLIVLLPVRLMGTWPLVRGEDRRWWFAKVARFQRLWWLGVVILFVSSGVYLNHCI